MVLPPLLRRMEVPMRGCAGCYHALVPWQEFEQVRVAVFHPLLPPTSLTPFMCVAAFTVVLL